MDEQPQGQAGNLTALAQAAPELREKPLTDAEKLLLENISSGKEADCSKLDDKGEDPEHADQWTEKRRIRAELLAWLCISEQARKHIHPRGIQVLGVDVTGELDLSFVNVPFQLMLQNCRVRKPINLRRAKVKQLDLQGSLVQGIAADGLIVKNQVFFRNFNARGEVRLVAAQIGGDLSCNGATITSTDTKKDRVALNADRINVKGGVFLASGKNAKGKDTKFTAIGEVRLPGAHIDGQLSCLGGQFINPGGYALSAFGAVVKSSVFLSNGFSADGTVDLKAIQIDGELNCTNGNFEKATLDLTDATAGALIDSGMNHVDSSTADASPTSWPPGDADTSKPKHYLCLDGFVYGRIASEGIIASKPKHYLLLDGFVYGRIASDGRIVVDKRLQWLERQPRSPFRVQPYLQLAKVLQEAGDTEGAVRVKERMQQLRFQQEPGLLAPVESFILRKTIGYGYDPLHALRWEVLLGGVGWIIYRRSYLAGCVTPTDKDACTEFKKTGGKVPAYYPRFSPLVFSVENSLPLVKLGQGDNWRPDPEREVATRESRPATEFGYRATWGWLPGWLREGWKALGGKLAAIWEWLPVRLRECLTWLLAKTASPRFVMWFLWFQILVGWLLATLFVAGVSGVVHKE